MEADLIRPAEQGTRNVVTAAARYARDTLKKVVVTSSVAGGCGLPGAWPAGFRRPGSAWCEVHTLLCCHASCVAHSPPPNTRII